MNLKAHRGKPATPCLPLLHLNHIKPHNEILLAKGLDDKQTPGYFGEAKEGGRKAGRMGRASTSFSSGGGMCSGQ